MSAQLQSGLVAMEVALTLREPELSFEAAKKYIELADLARQLYVDKDLGEAAGGQTHNWASLMLTLQDLPAVTVQRRRRLPHVRGDADIQEGILRAVLDSIKADSLVATFRQRGDDLILAFRGAHQIPQELVVAGSRQALFTAARQLSLAAIRGYVLARRSRAACIRIVVTRGVAYLHFEVVRQLRIPLSDE